MPWIARIAATTAFRQSQEDFVFPVILLTAIATGATVGGVLFALPGVVGGGLTCAAVVGLLCWYGRRVLRSAGGDALARELEKPWRWQRQQGFASWAVRLQPRRRAMFAGIFAAVFLAAGLIVLLRSPTLRASTAIGGGFVIGLATWPSAKTNAARMAAADPAALTGRIRRTLPIAGGLGAAIGAATPGDVPDWLFVGLAGLVAGMMGVVAIAHATVATGSGAATGPSPNDDAANAGGVSPLRGGSR